MRKYSPDVRLSHSLSVRRSSGFTALFTPDDETNRRIETQSAQKAQASVEALAPSTATTSTSAKKRKVSPNPASMTEFREILASLQNQIAEIRGENETTRKTHAEDIEALRKELRKVSRPSFRPQTLTTISTGYNVNSPFTSSRPTRPCAQKSSGTPRPQDMGRPSRLPQ
ncbi:uncharacterized protein F5147DRAFT_683508 [Suillus discolor]|uniref:Uncharacterized protein n=1 Tax=Suillus discolor TaxID=1912936 RepID=A0A9P7FCW7_9AGAM|nr:uncharacterized protein F5147DRAFT_683508 [Suillus discolor]KAG2112573.1 hypothetical protein F5147DRAFT_683508 [Suillus discolor]